MMLLRLSLDGSLNTTLFLALDIDWTKLKNFKLTEAKNFDGPCFEALLKAAPNLEVLDLDG